MQRSTMGVGPALRKVREARRVSIEEAARDTRIRREFLEAIEEESFEDLLGEVHVRGCLRTYATYLRLSPDKVVSAYAEGTEAPAPSASAPPLQPEPVLGAPRRRDNHRLIALVAVTVLVLAAAFGVLSARDPAPPPAELPTQAPLTATETRGITVALLARQPVEVTVTTDAGDPELIALEAGEGRTFEANRNITIRLSSGGTTRVTVSGKDLGFAGKAGEPWEETFSYDVTGASPTPSG